MTDNGYVLGIKNSSDELTYRLEFFDLLVGLNRVPIWKGVRGQTSPFSPHAFYELPTAFLRVKDSLFVGTDAGNIEEIELKIDQEGFVRSGRTVVKIGPRLTVSGRDLITSSINSLVWHDGDVYDASMAGLFETIGCTEIDGRYIASAETLGDRLLVVPYGINRIRFKEEGHGMRDLGETLRESNASNDVNSGEVIMEKVNPFDGSGYAPGKHFISGDRVFISHGDWPNELITIRDLKSGETEKEVRIATTYFFVEHDGQVYDARMCSEDGRLRETRILRSDEDYSAPSGSLFDVPTDVSLTSVASADEKGLLLALYRRGENKTSLVSHLDPTKKILEVDGTAWITKL